MGSSIEYIVHRSNKKTRRALVTRAAHCAIEMLEARQLLSSVVTTFPIPSPNPSSYYGGGDIVAGPDGNYWFTDSSDNSIGKVTPAGQVALFPLPVHNVSDGDGDGGVSPDDPEPLDIVVGPNGNLWFTESGVDRIGEITTAGKITEFETPTSDSYPEGLAVGSDGNLWFAETGNNIIGKVTPSGQITEYPLSTLQTDDDGLVEGSDGNIWFIAEDQNYDGVIAKITPSGVVTSYSLDPSNPSDAADPTALAAGPDGNLWVGTDSGVVLQVNTAGTVTGTFSLPSGDSVTSISPGTNNTLWMALSGGGNDQFGEVSTSGIINTFELPSSGADSANASISMSDLIEGAGGTLWFVDSANPQVGTIDLTDALLSNSDDISVTAGSPQTSTFASFVDFSGAAAASDYTATITLSGGTTFDGSIAANSSGGFDVTASNTWPIGSDTATVTITDTRNTSRIATSTDPVDATAPTATGTGVNITATSGQVFTGTVATFTGVAMNSLSSYSASINWGDGHTTTGTITANSSGGVDISGTNSYADAGTYSVVTTLSPYPTGVFLPPVPFSPVLPIEPINPGGPIVPVAKITAISGKSGAVPIVAPVGKPVSTPTTGTAVPGASGGANATAGIELGSGSVVGTPITISPPVGVISPPISIISPPGGIYGGEGGATATSTATVAAGAMQGTGYSVSGSSSQAFSGIVADFTLANPSADLSDLQATVTWKDPGIANWWYQLSNPPSAGVIAPDGNGGFTVSTSTTFSSGGLYHFVVTITNSSLGTGAAAQVGVAYGQVIVDSPIVWLPILFAGTPTAATDGTTTSNTSAVSAEASNPVIAENVKAAGVNISVSAGKTFSGQVGHLSGIASGTDLADLQGTIHWGDGTTSTATFTGGKGGAVTVDGSHLFAQGGTQAITVDVTQALSTQGNTSQLYPRLLPQVESKAKVNAPKPAPITIGGIAITAQAGTLFDGSVASFTDSSVATGATLTATLSWGDGKKSAGIVALTSGQITVTASHTYRKAGKYKVLIKVTEETTSGKSKKVAKLLASIATSAVVS